jgi:hypothetical protein
MSGANVTNLIISVAVVALLVSRQRVRRQEAAGDVPTRS